MSDRLLPIAGTILGTAAGTAIGAPQLGAVAGGALGGLGGGAIRGNPLQGLASGAIGGAGSTLGSNLLGDFFGGQLGKVLPQLPNAALEQNVIASEGLGEIIGRTGSTDELLAALGPGQSTGLAGFSSNQIGRGVGGLIGGGLAGTVANQRLQGGGPQPIAPPRLPTNLGPLPGAPPNLQGLVVKTGGGLPQTLAELLRRR